jgi:hypothetical protein
METFSLALTDAQKAQLTLKAEAAGINPAGGTLPETRGVVLSFVLSGNTVTFTVVERPFFVSLGMIRSGIRNMIAAAS